MPGLQVLFNIHKSINVMHHINKMKVKIHIIILLHAEKTSVKMQHPFMIKPLNKVSIEERYLNIIKATYVEPTANIILNGEKLNAFPIR